MIHIRIDDHPGNAKARFACGVAVLPPGDTYYFTGEGGAWRADCPGCNPSGPRPLGTPLSELSGRPGQSGYDRFRQIALSWGYD